MLMNFCDPCLKTSVTCKTVTTEGYEPVNLVNGSSKGFLAYSCIKPPVHIDFTFACSIKIHHVVIWPCVGAQKSTGFQLATNWDRTKVVPYECVSSGQLKDELGLLFYRKDANQLRDYVPPNFLQRYIRLSKQLFVDSVNCLRISIFKTENSVPALGRIEVWGYVSKDLRNTVMELMHEAWINKDNPQRSSKNVIVNVPAAEVTSFRKRKRDEHLLSVSEKFLDPITCEIMIQPIIMPSGNIIDQSTLEKYTKNEALWGRMPSDPFTGLLLNEHRRPIIANKLKVEIDKYLLEHSNDSEIKKMPRVLNGICERSLQLTVHNWSEILTKDVKCEPREVNVPARHIISTSVQPSKRNIDTKHKLPINIISKRKDFKAANVLQNKVQQSNISNVDMIVDNNELTNSETDVSLEENVRVTLSGLRSFSEGQENTLKSVDKCSCCTLLHLYILPCKHLICRKKLMESGTNILCESCGKSYGSSDPRRYYV
ncbi:RING finger protein 37 [Orussus abietinus]|uniref:RING finger protein 37 n=1 Tax=Orussus abietinus TaxID=222816 RepID=UPI000625DD09|nr:RING finger protein 37 [Orussus abietinus]